MTDTIETLWLDHHHAIASYIGKNVRGSWGQETVEDLVSIVFLRATVATSNGNGVNAHARGWLYQIARSVMWDLYRAKQNITLVDFDSLAEYPANWSLEDEAAANMRNEQLLRAVDRLSDKQQDAIGGRLLGYTHGEIAAMLGSTEAAVKQANLRAYECLRELLQDAA